MEEADESIKTNQIFLDGYICKPPVYRKTPLGREIADLLLAVNRPYGKSDYIPCICWEGMPGTLPPLKWAVMCFCGAGSRAGNILRSWEENETEKRTAYEVSVSKLEYAD